MQRDPRLYLFDIKKAALTIQRFVEGKSFEDYVAQDVLRSGVERQFTILGEALYQMRHQFPTIAGRVPQHAKIIAFRHVLIHGYAVVQDETVYGVASQELDALIAAIDVLTDELT